MTTAEIVQVLGLLVALFVGLPYLIYLCVLMARVGYLEGGRAYGDKHHKKED